MARAIAVTFLWGCALVLVAAVLSACGMQTIGGPPPPLTVEQIISAVPEVQKSPEGRRN